MKFEFELSEKELKEAVIKKIIDVATENYFNGKWFSGKDADVRATLQKRIPKILGENNELTKEIDQKIKAALIDERIINQITKEFIKEKLRREY